MSMTLDEIEESLNRVPDPNTAFLREQLLALVREVRQMSYEHGCRTSANLDSEDYRAAYEQHTQRMANQE